MIVIREKHEMTHNGVKFPLPPGGLILLCFSVIRDREFSPVWLVSARLLAAPINQNRPNPGTINILTPHKINWYYAVCDGIWDFLTGAMPWIIPTEETCDSNCIVCHLYDNYCFKQCQSN